MEEEQEPGEAAQSYRYWAFISYSSKDASWARWLHRAIESYGIPARLVDHVTPTGEKPPKRLKPLFRDRPELAAGDLGTQIREALETSRYLIVICSPNAAQSRWVDTEIRSFRALGRTDRVLAMIVDGEPDAGDERECFPVALRGVEPLAADARPEGDGRRDARLKLLAGMLGVGFDVLKQRDQHRRIRRLQATIAAAAALALSFAGLAYVATVQRDKAVKARNQSEEVVEYLLYDLIPQRLVPLGKLSVIDDVQKQTEAYYRKLGLEKSIPVTLHNRSTSLNVEGNSLLTKGRYADALGRYRDGLRVAERLVAFEPDALRWKSDIFVSRLSIGQVLEARAYTKAAGAGRAEDLAQAMRNYQESLSVTSALARREPDKPLWKRYVAVSHSNIGNVLDGLADLQGDAALEKQGRLQALSHYETSSAIMRPLTKAYPANEYWLDDISVTESNIGYVLERLGKPREALQHYQSSLVVILALAKRSPDNTVWQHDVGAARRDVGNVLLEQGRLRDALVQYKMGLAIMKRLNRWERGNVDWEEDLSWFQAKVRSLTQ
jgi:eukaryotic-like serine/threonine-protein kinase